MNDFIGSMIGILVVLAIAFVIFLILREFYCWYFKINRHLKNQIVIDNKLNQLIEEQKRTNELLEKIAKQSEKNDCLND